MIFLLTNRSIPIVQHMMAVNQRIVLLLILYGESFNFFGNGLVKLFANFCTSGPLSHCRIIEG